MSANRLVHETSPYLLQHAHNPVDWFPWGVEAFDKAKAENKPVLLSIGYSSCHWCHVMERESFEDPQTAALMNELYVNIKVDREERPDLDDIYMKAVQLLIGRGGWPMTVFLTPNREPFHGGTYFPPTDRHGLPSFSRLLRAVAQAFHEKPGEIEGIVQQLLAGVESMDRTAAGDVALDPTLPAKAAQALMGHVDMQDGGLGGAPKFPHTQAFQLLLRQAHRSKQPTFVAASRLAGERMGRGGMYDQVGGGFHRYSVDAVWLVPHFEKMLYDNAQLPRLYVDLWQTTRDPWFRTIAEETLDYLLRDMRHPLGGFFSATDADSEGEEGKYFVWSRAEVARLVDPAAVDLVCRYWDITAGGNFEGHNIPHVSRSLADVATEVGFAVERAPDALREARSALLAARVRRVAPARDEKILTGWNALTISALATAGAALRVQRFVDAAGVAADFLWTQARQNDRLLHGWAAGAAKGEAFLDDHAYLANASLDLFEATSDVRHLDRARALVTELEARFHDPEGGAYFFTPHDGEALIARTKPGADGAVPSGNAVAAVVLLRLHYLTGVEIYRTRAEEILRCYFQAATKNPFAFATYLEAFELYTHGPTEIVIVGDPKDPATEALLAASGRCFVPGRLGIMARPGMADVPEPARDRPAVGGRPTAYVCRDFACAAPVTDPAALEALLVG